MEHKVLVSLVSEQTLPNVELIKEFKDEIDKYLFITTSQMNEQLKWIIASAKIENIDTIEVNPFDIEDIEKKISAYNFGDEEIILNITGGTKLMSLIVNEVFKNLGAKIFYLTGHDKSYVKVFPNRKERVFILKSSLSLREYLTAYGFGYEETRPYLDYPMAKRIFEYYIRNETSFLKTIFEPIRLRRGRSMNVDKENIRDFLSTVRYPTIETLSKKDTKYLSGDWFEEYIFYKIKEELNLHDNEIATGLNLRKQGIPNEIDVIFIYHHKLFIIECKTSIVDYRRVKRIRQGEEVEEEKKIKLLPEIINKSDALRSKFGLFANTNIITLEEIKTEKGLPVPGYETHFERASLSRINIISKRDIVSDKSMSILLKIK